MSKGYHPSGTLARPYALHASTKRWVALGLAAR